MFAVKLLPIFWLKIPLTWQKLNKTKSRNKLLSISCVKLKFWILVIEIFISVQFKKRNDPLWIIFFFLNNGFICPIFYMAELQIIHETFPWFLKDCAVKEIFLKQWHVEHDTHKTKLANFTIRYCIWLVRDCFEIRLLSCLLYD